MEADIPLWLLYFLFYAFLVMFGFIKREAYTAELEMIVLEVMLLIAITVANG